MGSPTIGGDITGTVIEDSGVVITGNLDDVNPFTSNNDDTWSISVPPSFGLATINPTTGVWSYDLDDTNPVVNALGAGEPLTDTFTVLMVDNSGTGAGQSDTQVVTITITGVPCFVGGTFIETNRGLRAIETIQPGERVVTQNGMKQVSWVGHRVLSRDELRANPKLCPVRIVAGALGNGLPERDLLVSRQHRMLVQSRVAERMFGMPEVLLPAIKLVELPGIYLDDSLDSLEYFHLLFSDHEIIYAEGAPTESLFTGPEALASLSPEAKEEILTLFPEVAELDYTPEPARYIPPVKRQKQLIARHAKNNKPLLSYST